MSAVRECDEDEIPISREALIQLRRQLLRTLAEVEERLGMEPSVLPRRLRRRSTLDDQVE